MVGTSDAQDFQLLQDVTDGISELVSENKFVNRLHRLCSTLIELCKPLIHAPSADVGTAFGAAPIDGAMLPTGSRPEQLMVPDTNGNIDNFLPSSWQDDMMWQLFQSQPSLDWFNADILDPNWGDFGVPK